MPVLPLYLGMRICVGISLLWIGTLTASVPLEATPPLGMDPLVGIQDVPVSPALPKAPNVIRIVAEFSPPFTNAPGLGSPDRGYLIALLERIFEPQGIQIHYESQPFRRALYSVKTQEADCIAGISTQRPGLVLPTIAQGTKRFAFFVRAGDPWRYETVASLKRVRLGVVAGRLYTPELTAYCAAHTQDGSVEMIEGAHATEQNIRKLQSGRIDVFLGIQEVVAAHMRKHENSDTLVLAGFASDPLPVYVACSDTNSSTPAFMQILEAGMTELTKNGGLEQLQTQYNLGASSCPTRPPVPRVP